MQDELQDIDDIIEELKSDDIVYDLFLTSRLV